MENVLIEAQLTEKKTMKNWKTTALILLAFIFK